VIGSQSGIKGIREEFRFVGWKPTYLKTRVDIHPNRG
jgi:hypothetical protein